MEYGKATHKINNRNVCFSNIFNLHYIVTYIITNEDFFKQPLYKLKMITWENVISHSWHCDTLITVGGNASNEIYLKLNIYNLNQHQYGIMMDSWSIYAFVSFLNKRTVPHRRLYACKQRSHDDDVHVHDDGALYTYSVWESIIHNFANFSTTASVEKKQCAFIIKGVFFFSQMRQIRSEYLSRVGTK